MYEMERQFFCNMLTYLDDCRKAGVRSSVPQLAIFAMDAWLPLEVIWVPGGEYVRFEISAEYDILDRSGCYWEVVIWVQGHICGISHN